ncbi:MAG: PAS domain-containing protein, partial [Bacteroidia bacterium]
MSKKSSNTATILPVYEEYHTFLQEMGSSSSLKDYTYYLKQYSFFKNMVNALPSAVYILNFETKQYPFISQSSLSLLGYSAKEYMEKDRDFFTSHIHPDDMKIQSGAAFVKFIEYTKQLTPKEIKKCRFSINYRIKRKDGVYIKVLQQYAIIEVTDKGYPLLCLGLLTDITDHKADNKVVFSISKYDKKKGFEV